MQQKKVASLSASLLARKGATTPDTTGKTEAEAQKPALRWAALPSSRPTESRSALPRAGIDSHTFPGAAARYAWLRAALRSPWLPLAVLAFTGSAYLLVAGAEIPRSLPGDSLAARQSSPADFQPATRGAGQSADPGNSNATGLASGNDAPEGGASQTATLHGLPSATEPQPPPLETAAGPGPALALPAAVGDARIFPFAASGATRDQNGDAVPGPSIAALPREGLALPPTRGIRGDYHVQLYALGSWAAAQKAWIELLADNVALLADLEPRVEKFAYGDDRRALFRLQAGIVPSLFDAQLLCRRLRARNIDCLVVAPPSSTAPGTE